MEIMLCCENAGSSSEHLNSDHFTVISMSVCGEENKFPSARTLHKFHVCFFPHTFFLTHEEQISGAH